MMPLVNVAEKEHHIASNAHLLLAHAQAPRYRAWRLPGAPLRLKRIQRKRGYCVPVAIVVAPRPCLTSLKFALPSL